MTLSVNVSVEEGLSGIQSIDFATVAPKNNPTFTGNVYLPESTYISQSGSNVLLSGFATLTSPVFVNPTLSTSATSSSPDLAIANVGYVNSKVNSTFSNAGYATQTWVSTQITNLINGAGPALDTLGEIATQLATDESATAAIVTSLTNKQDKDADLTAIAGLSGTSGFLKKTAADTWSLDTNTYASTSQTMYIGTTAVAINRGSASLALTGISTINGFTLSPTTGTLTISNGKTISSTASLTITGNDASMVIGSTTVANGTTSLDFANYSFIKLTPTATASLTTTVPPAGSRCTLMILTSGVSSYTLTFGTNFHSTGTLATGTTSARYFVINFISDGTGVFEVSRTVAMA